MNSALACFASAGAQGWARRRGGHQHRSQAVGLALLAIGLVLLVVSSATHSLPTVLAGAVVTGVGHGLAFPHAQHELNTLAPQERRAEVSAAFVCCVYVLVGGSVIAVGLIDEADGLTRGVALVGTMLTAASVATAGWQLGTRSLASP